MAAPIELSTENKLQYHFFPNSSGVVQFKVRATNDAHIALTHGASESDPMYEIFIGGWKNSRSVIRKNRKQPDVAQADTPNILKDGEFRSFWIRWNNGTITAGNEGNSTPFLSYTDSERVPIEHVGVCTGWGATGSWIIEQPQGGRPLHDSTNIELSTENKLEYHFFPNSSGVFQFKVRARNDAHIALTHGASESDPMYEIFIGGWKNTRSVIRKSRKQPEVAQADTPNILNEGEFRGFWIRWNNGTITAGNEGNSTPFLSYTDSERVPIEHVGVCTGWGATGSWIIGQPQGGRPGSTAAAAARLSPRAVSPPPPPPPRAADGGNVPPGAYRASEEKGVRNSQQRGCCWRK